MNCRSLSASSSIMTFRPALPSILVMVSIVMFLLGMLDDTEVTQIPPDSLVHLLADELVAARRGLPRTGARAYRHHVPCVLSYLSYLFRLRLGRDRPFDERHVETG